MLATTLGLCLTLLATGQAPQTAEYRAAYALGQAEADRELREGRARIYIYGLVARDWLDPGTGLVLQPIAGCVVDDSILGRAAGHNERIQQVIQRRGVPANSLRRWQREIADPAAVFASLGPHARPQPLRAGGPVITTPDGRARVSVSLVAGGPVPGADGSGSVVAGPSEMLNLRFGTDRPSDLPPPWPRGARPECVWGPPGSNLLFLRWTEPAGVRHAVIELQTGHRIDPQELSNVLSGPTAGTAVPPPR